MYKGATACRIDGSGYLWDAGGPVDHRPRGDYTMLKFTVEYTDTFGGEANYTWVKRTTMVVKHYKGTQWVKRCAKDVVGLRGVKGKWEDYGDDLIFRPRGSATVLFVIFEGEL